MKTLSKEIPDYEFVRKHGEESAELYTLTIKEKFNEEQIFNLSLKLQLNGAACVFYGNKEDRYLGLVLWAVALKFSMFSGVSKKFSYVGLCKDPRSINLAPYSTIASSIIGGGSLKSQNVKVASGPRLSSPYLSGLLFFEALFKIRGFIESKGFKKQVPLMYFIMSRRTVEDYSVVFVHILNLMGKPEAGVAITGLNHCFVSSSKMACDERTEPTYN
uniref:Uncharacterized protein n=1 Tax=Daphnia galeata TaxID=27404 RepID=A0A8J2S911_9CRUS|nr:unnamed protein product [Daphnia galeata]